MKARKILALVLALALACVLLPMAAMAADSDFTIVNGVLTKYNGPGGDVVIPSTVTTIGDKAFAGCALLTSVTIPDSVTKIGDRAFAGCGRLTSVTIPDSVTKIGDRAFENCSRLTSVMIHSGVTEIGEGAFWYCSSLTTIVIPSSVTKIGGTAFFYCSSLTSITIPNSVTEIGDAAFGDCTGLTDIIISDSVTEISKNTFVYCSNLTTIVIPSSVTKIGGAAFYKCSSLTSIVIPTSVTEIDGWAFDSTSLTDVYYGGTEAQWKAIKIDGWNDSLKNDAIYYNTYGGAAPAAIHYNTYGAAAPAAPTTLVAYPSTQSVNVDGRAIEFQCYALKDEKGYATNYTKLRDLAILLNGSAAQFQVGWDGSVTITTKTVYTPNGSELSTPFSGERPYQETTATTKVNGQAADLAAFVLNDDAGGGYTYYQLRDLGKALGFNVGWAADRGIYLETDKEYDPSN